jgi:hypothetical protein
VAAYLISRKDVDDLETIVFAVGREDNEEAIAVFTDERTAEKYIHDAGLDDEFTVAMVEPIPMLQWIVQAYEDGVQHLVLNPDFADQQAGRAVDTLSVEAHLEHAAEHILQFARPDF